MTVRCQTTEGGVDVGAQVVLAMAARAGIPPLAADRLRGDVREALRAANAAVELRCSAGDEGLEMAISPPGEALEAVKGALDGHGADIDGEAVVVSVRRTQLRSV
ncbi:MAG TPA: hypothetical protein VFJ66_02245 [Gaiellales bacterium]|nr:hypothetical protein [Gaiellales bacterium]